MATGFRGIAQDSYPLRSFTFVVITLRPQRTRDTDWNGRASGSRGPTSVTRSAFLAIAMALIEMSDGGAPDMERSVSSSGTDHEPRLQPPSARRSRIVGMVESARPSSLRGNLHVKIRGAQDRVAACCVRPVELRDRP